MFCYPKLTKQENVSLIKIPVSTDSNEFMVLILPKTVSLLNLAKLFMYTVKSFHLLVSALICGKLHFSEKVLCGVLHTIFTVRCAHKSILMSENEQTVVLSIHCISRKTFVVNCLIFRWFNRRWTLILNDCIKCIERILIVAKNFEFSTIKFDESIERRPWTKWVVVLFTWKK